MKNFTSVKDVDNIKDLLHEAISIKKDPFLFNEIGKNKTLGLVFFNPSLRTRLSSQKAGMNLGMNVMVLDVGKDGWQLEFGDGVIMDGDTQEHVIEAAGVISQYCDIIGLRAFPELKDREEDYSEKVLNQFIKHAKVPVISLESATLHPLQSFADLITIEEFKTKDRPKVVLTWAPHPKALPQSVANSFAEWMLKANVDLTIAHPKGYELSESFTKGAHISHNPEEAYENADFIYAKNWSSYKDYGKILSKDKSWMVDTEKMALTNNGKFMHCLPVRRNVIVSDAVIDSSESLVLAQSYNRVISCQAVLKNLLVNG